MNFKGLSAYDEKIFWSASCKEGIGLKALITPSKVIFWY